MKRLILNYVFLMYGLIMIYLYFSKIINKMIHPRNQLFVLLSGICLIIMVVINIKEKKTLNIIYIIPLVLFMFLNNGDLSNRMIRNKGINIGNKIKKVVDDQVKKKDTKLNKDVYIELNDVNYLYYANSISEYTFDFIGSKIRLIGYIYRDKTLKKDQFIIGRLGLNCCAPDASLVGFLSSYDKYDEIITNDWYEVEGHIGQTFYMGVEVPLIEVVNIKKINKPNVEYVY